MSQPTKGKGRGRGKAKAKATEGKKPRRPKGKKAEVAEKEDGDIDDSSSDYYRLRSYCHTSEMRLFPPTHTHTHAPPHGYLGGRDPLPSFF